MSTELSERDREVIAQLLATWPELSPETLAHLHELARLELARRTDRSAEHTTGRA